MMPPFDMFSYIAASTSDFGRPNRGRRERITYNKKQLDILEDTFSQTHYPDVYRREQLSALLGIPEGRVQVWFKNRRARFRHNRLPNTEYQRIPAEFGHGKLKTSKPASPELHPSPPMPSSASADSSSSQSAASLSPSLSISLPKTENYTEVPFDAPQLQQIKDFEKSFYSMSFQGHGNFWPASNWQTAPYYPLPYYPQSYVAPMPPNSAAIYGYPQPTTMPQTYPNFYPSPAAFTNPYDPEKDDDSTKDSKE